MAASHIPARAFKVLRCSPSPYAHATSPQGVKALRSRSILTTVPVLHTTGTRRPRTSSQSPPPPLPPLRTQRCMIHTTCSQRQSHSTSSSSANENNSKNTNHDPKHEPSLADSGAESAEAEAETKRTGHQIDISQTHYDTLALPPHASSAEIKRSFYKLSKQHHPDHNLPASAGSGDGHQHGRGHHGRHKDARRRFLKLSEAYAVLSHPDKRRIYDRSIRVGSGHAGHAGHHGRRGSYHGGPAHGSTAGTAGGGGGVRYAGGRPASGLSKRRGHFQGPPTSFYRSGGWGQHADARKEEHERSTQTEGGKWWGNTYAQSQSHGSSPSSSAAGTEGGTYPGMGPGADPFHHHNHHRRAHRYGANHFDPVAHEERQRRVAESINSRSKAKAAIDSIPRGDIYAGVVENFLVILGVMIIMMTAPGLLGALVSMSDTRGPPRGDGNGPRRKVGEGKETAHL